MGEQQITGPDLVNEGYPLESLPAGGLAGGHAAGESVLLANVEGTIYAMGGQCSHYSGPLAEGVLDEQGCVRCPWHHARFDVRTGRVDRPPALHNLPRWDVVVRDGRVFVGARHDAAPLEPAAGSIGAPATIVILGAGAAGNVAAETLRREGYAGRVVVVDAEKEIPYDKPNISKDFLAGNAPPEWIPLHDAAFYEEHSIELQLGERVASLDVAAGHLTFESGRTLSYDRLLLATGASPIRLDVPTDGSRSIQYLRTLADSKAIIAAAEHARSALVIGASFIGLEVAASLRTRGLDVHVVAPEQRPLERVLGSALGARIQELHEAHGVAFHLGTKPARIERGAIVLENGDSVAVDIVIAGVGVRPNVQLGDQAGLRVDNGIFVDEFLATSAPNVFAAGDIARYPEAATGRLVRVEHWVAAQRQGQTAARNMLGQGERFTAVPFFWSAHYDAVINYAGHAERPERIVTEGSIEDLSCVVTYYENGRRAAVATIFRDDANLRSELEMEREALQTLVSV